MHEFYIFPTDCLDDLEDMSHEERMAFFTALTLYWTSENLADLTRRITSDIPPVVKIALRHSIIEIEEIKEEIEG